MDSRNPYVKLFVGLLCTGVPCLILIFVGLAVKSNPLIWGSLGVFILIFIIWVEICFPKFWKKLFKGPDAE